MILFCLVLVRRTQRLLRPQTPQRPKVWAKPLKSQNAHIFEDEDDDEDEDDWRPPPSRRADQDTRQKHQNTTENDLENGR